MGARASNKTPPTLIIEVCSAQTEVHVSEACISTENLIAEMRSEDI